MMSKKVELIVKVKLPLCIVSGYFHRYKENYLDENKIWVNMFSSWAALTSSPGGGSSSATHNKRPIEGHKSATGGFEGSR